MHMNDSMSNIIPVHILRVHVSKFKIAENDSHTIMNPLHEDFHGKYVLVPADKTANNVVVV